MHQEIPLPLHPELFLVVHLAPGIGGNVLDATGVPRIRLDLARHMVVAQSHVVPLSRGEILELDGRASILHRAPLLADAGQLAVEQEHVQGGPPLRS